MQITPLTLFALATVSLATLSATAQADATQAPAPIVRSAPSQNGAAYNNQAEPNYDNQPAPGYNNPGAAPAAPQITNSQPIPGVLLRTEPGATVQTIAADAQGTQLRIEHGRANISVHHPASKSEILVDLPGGEVSLLKDGLYTFNADTNTVRVLKGEAAAFTSTDHSDKGIKIKEEQQLTFSTTDPRGLRSVDTDRRQLVADLLPTDGNRNGDGYRDGNRGYGYAPYSYYGGYPRFGYGYGYPGWGYGYPYGYGIGLGFGYYGGYRGFGGFRGGYGGFRGGYRGFRR